MDKTTGACKATKASQVILDKADHLMVRAENLRAVAAGLEGFLIGPKPEPTSPEKTAPSCSFIGQVTDKLDELGDVLAEVQGHLDLIREKF